MKYSESPSFTISGGRVAPALACSARALALTASPAVGTIAVNDNGTPNPSDDFVDYTPPVGFKGTDMDDATRPAGQWTHDYLRIDPNENVVPTGNVLTFRSLGDHPQLTVTLADRQRFSALGWG